MSKKNDLKLLRTHYLRGPNIWTYRPVMEVWLDLGELEDYPSHLLPGFNDRLTAALPALPAVALLCGRFVDRVLRGEDDPRLLAQATRWTAALGTGAALCAALLATHLEGAAAEGVGA